VVISNVLSRRRRSWNEIFVPRWIERLLFQQRAATEQLEPMGETLNDSTIFVAPDGIGNPQGWANSNGQEVTLTDDILRYIQTNYCVDTSRIFANGFSYGGGMSKAIGCARANVFYGSHGLGDPTNQYASGKTIRDRFVRNNGCTSQSPPEPAMGSGAHVCTSYSGCSSGHPTRWCAFDGVHDPSPKDRGQTNSWNPRAVWTFFTQF
jgi:poly(3-hydroxybutyrate) depolymerase